MHTHEIKIILYSFIGLILFGAVLLSLPFAHHGELRFIDALFTSTSAVCVTGLIVKDTPVDFTSFGHIVILTLIQIGGLGYMTAVTFMAVMRKQKINHRDRLILKESLNHPGMDGLVRFIKIVFASIIIIEAIGMVILTLRFWVDMPLGKAAWFGTFHAISAFNNAGFSLFSDNMMGYRGDFVVNITVPLLIILGGLGYMVLLEIYNYRRGQLLRISTHTKIVLYMSGVLILIGMALLLSLEWNNPKSFGSLSTYEKILAAWFASVNYRTAGFNSIDFSTLTDANLFFSTFLMMTGGSPGGTAGGIKTTVVALALIGVWYTLRGDTHAHIFRRSISPYQINKAYAVIFIASIYVVISTIILSEVDRLPFLRILFETTSAFGTVGLSTGNGGVLSYSALFSDAGKLNIIVLMLMGRVGVFAFTIIIVGKALESRIKYAEGKVII
ncbi:MAG TPA: potassium transporter [Sulfuricurvum sp.]|nr:MULTISPECIES: TrkH family potassium uptake protein [unclassified Sulfuricurvum]OHD85287.1 MAG: potassium transporter [Sulfuricurvum sp. RIFCSPLOWO2_02_FULL_43_45]OHD91028.1 MAG: potassium transporter [Sulfuricurvum sp. RIFCSPLOWO2_12_FULL_43_24]HBM35169.1 potassium transporter [Sulfuricurvum sp.]